MLEEVKSKFDSVSGMVFRDGVCTKITYKFNGKIGRFLIVDEFIVEFLPDSFVVYCPMEEDDYLEYHYMNIDNVIHDVLSYIANKRILYARDCEDIEDLPF